MGRTAVVAASLSLASWLVSPSSHAGDAALAEQLFQEGITALEAGDAELACKKLSASLKAEPSGGTALNFGRCNEMLGKTATAWAEYKRAATLFQASREEERRAFALERAAALEATLPRLVIELSAGADAVVRRDGTPVPAAALGTEVPVDPGEYTIEANSPGHRRWSTTVTVARGGGVARVLVPALEPLTSPQRPPLDSPAPEAPPPHSPEPAADDDGPNGLVIVGGAFLGVGAVAAVIGGVLGAAVLSDADEAEDLCGGNECDGSVAGREGFALSQDASGKATASTMLVGVGAAVALGGAVLLVIGVTSEEDPSTGASPRLAPQLGPSFAGLGLTGRF